MGAGQLVGPIEAEVFRINPNTDGVPECHKCHRPWHSFNDVLRTCVEGRCTVVVHRPCGTVQCSWGDIGCPCGEKVKLLPKLNRRSGRRWRT